MLCKLVKQAMALGPQNTTADASSSRPAGKQESVAEGRERDRQQRLMRLMRCKRYVVQSRETCYSGCKQESSGGPQNTTADASSSRPTGKKGSSGDG
jgi:hypothetical protein